MEKHKTSPVSKTDVKPPIKIAPSDIVSRAKSKHASAALDEALIESFPASDPIAISITRIDTDV